jgi:glycosyltransferase involved in cell wall biosynthesis
MPNASKNIKKKVCFYSPYIPDHFGGGEKHLFDVMRVVAQKHQCFLAIPGLNQDNRVEIKEKYQQFLNYSLDFVELINSPIPDKSFWQKLLFTRKFDSFYYVTDGSLFLSFAGVNHLHIQIPFTDKKGYFDRLKLESWQVKNTNSEFTKKVIEKNWQTKIDLVHYPLVEAKEFKIDTKTLEKKEKIILNVGRFFTHLHSKRQDVLVKFFKEMCEKYPQVTKGWKLVLIGSIEDQEYFDQVRKNSLHSPIEIYTDVSRESLINWFKKSKIYWHATGFGINELENPEKVEHFGITTVEAMAAGTVPVVINKGGQKEVLSSELSELLWDDQNDCLSKTLKLIKEEKELTKFQKKVIERSEFFGKNEFEKRVWRMFNI